MTKFSTERLVGFAQVVMSCLFLSAYFAALAGVFLGIVRTPPEWKDVLITLLGVLTREVGTVLHFWFNRGRPAGDGTSADKV